MDRDYYRRNRNFGLWLGMIFLVAFYVIIAVGVATSVDAPPDLAVTTGAVTVLAGTLVGMGSFGSIMCACYCWAKYKNRSGWLALWGFLAPLGFIPLALMKDEGKS